METRHTEKISFKATPGFKAWLSSEANKRGLSISELIRTRCQKSNRTEVIFSMVTEMHRATQRASMSLERGLREAESTLNELKKRGDENVCDKRGLDGHKRCNVVSRQGGRSRQNPVRGL